MNSIKYSFSFVITTLLLTNAVQGNYFHVIRKAELECAKQTDIAWKDVLDYKNNTIDVSEKVLCFFKCKIEKLGLLDPFGILNMTLVAAKIQHLRLLPQSERHELVQCVENIDAIKTCGDMHKIRECIGQLKMFEKRTPNYWRHKIECAEETGISMEEFLHFHHNRRTPSGKFLCYLKCFYEREGRLDENGELNMDVIDHGIDADAIFWNNDQKMEYKECLINIGPIHSCQDTRQIIACFPDRRVLLQKRRAQCISELDLSKNNEIKNEGDLQEIRQNHLCYLRCMYQKDGSIDANGELNLEIINEHVDRMRFLTPERKAEIKECLGNIPPIKDCEYMESIFSCWNTKF